MRRLILLLLLPLLACNGSETATPSTPTVVAATQASPQPTAIPNTAEATQSPPTDAPPTLPGATTFPDANAYTWQPVASGLERPIDLQPDGSGRLYVVEKLGHIHTFQDGQVLETP